MAIIEIPDYLLETLQVTPDDLKIELALSLYQQQRLSFDQAWSLANSGSAAEFYQLLAEQDILSHRLKETDNRQAIPLLEVSQRLQKIEKLAYEFIIYVSLELRTPATSMVGFAEFLLKDAAASLTDFQKECLSSIRESGRHLLQNLGDFTDRAKLGSGWLELDIEEVNLNDLVEQVLAVITEYTQSKHSNIGRNSIKVVRPRLEYEIPPDLPNIWADKLRIQRILVEIFQEVFWWNRNAEGRVLFTINYDDDMVHIEVIDNEIGLPDHLVNRLPELSPTSKSIIKMHGGNINVHSQEGGGWTIAITIPIQQKSSG